MRWSSQFRQNSTCSALLQPHKFHAFRIQDFHLLWSSIPKSSTTQSIFYSNCGGLLPVQSPLLRESLLLSFPLGTKMFQFSGCCSSLTMYSLTGTNSSNWWVAPFGYLRVLVYLQLAVAFRCSSRPSSPSSAKASTVHSFFLNLTNIILSTSTIQFSKIYY